MDELREGLKRILTDNMQTYEDKVKEIKGLFKEAGYLSHEEIQSMLNTLSGGFAEIAKIAGYVRLSQDQSLPRVIIGQTIGSYQKRWIKEGCRKVEL